MGFKECSESNCDTTQRYLTKGLCSKHYWQLRVRGKTFVTYKDKRPAIVSGKIAKIPVGYKAKNGYAIVDAEYAWLDKYIWSFHSGYAATTIATKTVFMHTLILKPRKGFVSDHIDMDGLNNRINNLREANHTQNNANRVKYRNNKSGYKGVYILPSTKRVRAMIRINGRNEHLGCFETAEAAAEAYDKRAIELFGTFARLNYA